jgi:hypothetical protein
MPKATMNEYDGAVLGEHNVRLAGQFRVKPKPQPGAMQSTSDELLGL